jgi:hypothetical protein
MLIIEQWSTITAILLVLMPLLVSYISSIHKYDVFSFLKTIEITFGFNLSRINHLVITL